MKHLLYCLVILFSMNACNTDDYLIDGGTANPNVKMTTYDYLKSNPLFDTLVIAIDRAGLKDLVNSNITFYVPTDFTISTYVNKELVFRQGFDPMAKYTFDSIPVANLRDSLKMYMFPNQLLRDSLTKEGEIYTSLLGHRFNLVKQPVDAYGDFIVDKPEYLFFIDKKGDRFDTFDEYTNQTLPTTEYDTRIRVQTSGIITTTGVVHVLENSHTLFFHVPKRIQ